MNGRKKIEREKRWISLCGRGVDECAFLKQETEISTEGGEG